MRSLFHKRQRVRRRGRLTLAAGLTTCIATVGVAAAGVGGWDPFGNAQVDGQTVNGAILLPTNQWISPFGTRTILVDGSQTLPSGATALNGRLVSSTLSPDGAYMAALSWNDFTGFLTIIDVNTGQIVQQVGTGSRTDPYLGDGTVAADGPLYSADGTTLWVPQTKDIVRFTVDPSTGMVSSPDVIALPTASLPNNQSSAAEPSGMALSSDGSLLYVAFNGANTLGVINTSTNALVGQIPVGNAPRQVVLDGDTAYVSNEGGRPAQPGEFTNLSNGTPIVASPVTGGAITGTVSVVSLTPGASTPGQETQEIPVGLEPTALYLHESALFVANSNDDTFSVIDTTNNRVTQTVDNNPVPGADVGSYANAITMPDARHLLVSIGRDNAIAVYHYGGLYRPIRFEGLIPTDWYPVAVQADPALGGQIVVTNDKGIGARGPESTINKSAGGAAPTSPAAGAVTGHNTYDDTGSVTTFAMPSRSQLGGLTRTVFADNAWDRIPPINSGAEDTAPEVIPARLGLPSTIKHVVVIVRENRTYDQILGDLTDANGNPVGNGDPSLAQFGAPITPNEHALALRFGDLDNFYDEGTLSADGHNWIVQAEANDYVEKEFGAFYRSYPSQGGDALAYQRDGFLWDAAEKAGLSVQDFGEYAFSPYSLPAGAPNWDAFYKASQILEAGGSFSSLPTGTVPCSLAPSLTPPACYTSTTSDVPSLEKILVPSFPNFQLDIPDQFRVDTWLPIFQQDEMTGQMPNLTFMWLMSDHTGAPGPYPIAQVADNDLALGRVVDAISHSKFWESTAIFILEDDTQNGVDHVDGHRGPVFVISPYSKPGVDDQYYTQLNMVRTVEQILGIQPMNQEDGSAAPMYAAFTDWPSKQAFDPFTALPSNIQLDCGTAENTPTAGTPNPCSTTATESPAIRRAVQPPPAAERAVVQAWAAWLNAQERSGHFSGPDRVNAQQLNRYDWYTAHGWREAYPSDAKIYLPSQVPNWRVPAAMLP
ncbi:MAG: bifunctional YncE family protein/alkaline phosphatase family protein [Solirubrobacteraceae bacterium]